MEKRSDPESAQKTEAETGSRMGWSLVPEMDQSLELKMEPMSDPETE
jgi:hypothetical protein